MEPEYLERLRKLKEPMVTLSLSHLTADTRHRLLVDDLSVNAYPNDYGGLVYVGPAGQFAPTEPDLAALYEAAEQAGVLWLKFDSEGPVVTGLPVFTPDPGDDD